jgi:excisionase family DNA binding protein
MASTIGQPLPPVLTSDRGEPLFFTLSETALRLRVSVRTIEREIAEGKLVAARIRGLVRISAFELSTYIAASTTRCLSGKDMIDGKCASKRMEDALKRHFRPALPARTRSRSKLLCAARKSMV